MVTGPALALGVGRPSTQSALGQPLNLLFPVRLSADETLTPDCVRADVTAGDARVPSGLVQLLLEGAGDASVRGVRVLSSVAIDEPIVTVSLSLGCPTRFTRQFTAFIDPAGARPAAPVVPVVAALATLPAENSTAPMAQATPLTPATLAAAEGAPRSYSPALRAALATSDARPAALLATSSESSRSPATPVAKPSRPKSEPKPRRAVTAKVNKTATAPTSSGPRLRLDAPERVESTSLVASAAVPATAATAALQPELLLSLAQLEALGQSLAKVQQEQRATEARLLAMRAELEQAQARQNQREQGLRWWQAGMAVVILGLVGGCIYLWRSRRRERLLREQQWWASGQPVAAAPGAPAEARPQPAKGKPSQGPTPGLGPLVSRAGRTLPALPDAQRMATEPATSPVIDTSPAPFGLQDEALATGMDSRFADSGFATNAHLPTLPLPLPVPVAVPVSAGELPDRQVTVEELIDLEQQVDFFVVLGQDDAAIDLLQTRLNSGHANALPYLKLLELHQRRGDAVAYAHVAQQFGGRFGALPPTWGTNLNQGRSLESYDSAMQSLLNSWEDSSASMALLQNLLARGSGDKGDGERGFDLPAYRDLLMLYSVARDRAEQDMRSDDVDLLLPLEEGGNEGAATMATLVWQAQPSLVVHPSDALDISLDDEPVTRP